MNPFYIVGVAAKDGRLPESMDAAYYASEAFYERIRFEGRTGAGDKLAALLFMMQHVALDPREASTDRKYLDNGVVWLKFFGVANPVPMDELPIGSAELGMVKEAVDINRNGPLGKAAARVIRRRANLSRRHVQEDRVLDRLRKSLPWPSPADFSKNPDAAREAQSGLIAVLDDKCAQLRDRYQTRVATLARATMPGIASWTELLIQLTTATFRPFR